MDSNSNSEGGQGEEDMRGGGKYNVTINEVCQVKILFIVRICQIDATSINSNHQPFGTPISTLLSLNDNACSRAYVILGSVIRALSQPPSTNHNGRDTGCMTRVSPAATSSTTEVIISSGTTTSTLNGVITTQKSGSHAVISKSRSKPLRITKRVGMTEDDGTTDSEPVIGGLQDEDESLEHAAALASPIKGSDAQKLTKVSSIYISHDFSLIQTLSM